MAYAIVRGMARRRPEERRLSDAFREAYEAAGVSQTQIAEALGVDQPRVSKWARGESEPALHQLPVIDALCGQPRGHVLRLAGYVDDGVDVIAAIHQDDRLDKESRDAIILLYTVFLKRSEP